MDFRLISTAVTSLELLPASSVPSAAAPKFSTKHGVAYRAENPKEFAVIYRVDARLEPSLELKASFLAVFETVDAIDEDFKKSHFPQVNAPAVGYPYLRAFLSQFTALASCEILNLPIRNFSRIPAAKALADARPVPTELVDEPQSR